MNKGKIIENIATEMVKMCDGSITKKEAKMFIENYKYLDEDIDGTDEREIAISVLDMNGVEY